MKKWTTQFANDPRRDYNLYLELVKEGEPQGQIAREADGELYLSLFASPDVKIPFAWLVSVSAQAGSLPKSEDESG